jgi:divalent metal cation (Fe/Co/Zn/Cd) transporter
MVALAMIGGSNLLNNASWLDPVGGLAISLMVVQAGWGNTRQSLLELADVSVDEEMTSKLERSVNKTLANFPDSIQLGKISGMKSGQNYLMDIELAVPKTWTVERTRNVEDELREQVSNKVRGLKRLRVRWVTRDEVQAGAVSEEFIGADVSPRESPEPEEHGHDHDHDHDHAAPGHGENGLHKRK